VVHRRGLLRCRLRRAGRRVAGPDADQGREIDLDRVAVVLDALVDFVEYFFQRPVVEGELSRHDGVHHLFAEHLATRLREHLPFSAHGESPVTRTVVWCLAVMPCHVNVPASVAEDVTIWTT
jgi:hypothetical protein